MKKVMLFLILAMVVSPLVFAMGGTGGSKAGSCDWLSWTTCLPKCPDPNVPAYTEVVIDGKTRYVYSEEYKACVQPVLEQCFEANGCGADYARKAQPHMYN